MPPNESIKPSSLLTDQNKVVESKFSHPQVLFCKDSVGDGQTAFRLIKEQGDLERVTEFMYKHFLTGEPATMSRGGFPAAKRFPGLTKSFQEMVLDGLSVIAVDKTTDEILGMSIGFRVNRDPLEVDPPLSALITKYPLTWAYVVRVCDDTLSSQSVLAENTDISCGYYTYMLAVHQNHRGLGLGTRLTEHAIEVARSAGCQGYWAVATSDYSRKIFAKAGMSELKAMDWDSWTADDGERPFQNVSSREIVGMMRKI